MQLPWKETVLLALVLISSAPNTGAVPRFPAQFSAHVRVTAHMVDNAVESYPDTVREMELFYDSRSMRTKVTIHSGIDAGKTIFRLYDSKDEYMIREGDIPCCRRSILVESMPMAQLPSTSTYKGSFNQEGVRYDHWIQDYDSSRTHIYAYHDTQVPFRLTEEALNSEGMAVQVMAYEFVDITISPQEPETFMLPERHSSQELCDFHVGGFPYFHIFLHYFRV